MVYGHQIMRGKSPQVAGDEATPRVHIQTSRQSWRLTERKVYFVLCLDSQCGERIPRTLAMPSLVRPPRRHWGIVLRIYGIGKTGGYLSSCVSSLTIAWRTWSSFFMRTETVLQACNTVP